MNSSSYKLSKERMCRHLGYSRDAYYKAKNRVKEELDEIDQILALVHRERTLQPRLSGKKVYHLIKAELEEKLIKIGRDKLYDLLGQFDLLIKRRKSQCRTTDSTHAWRRYKNLVAGKPITGPNQVWVCDITYIRTTQGFVYLCLLMDAYSRKILGWCMHDSLEMEGYRKALKMALKTLPENFKANSLIHHSDQGVQYCCKAYTQILNRHNIQISMASKGNCYENAQAERLNGILKQEYGLGQTIKTKKQARKICAQAVDLYNNRRPHYALRMNFPNQVHEGLQTDVIMNWAKKVA